MKEAVKYLLITHKGIKMKVEIFDNLRISQKFISESHIDNGVVYEKVDKSHAKVALDENRVHKNYEGDILFLKFQKCILIPEVI